MKCSYCGTQKNNDSKKCNRRGGKKALRDIVLAVLVLVATVCSLFGCADGDESATVTTTGSDSYVTTTQYGGTDNVTTTVADEYVTTVAGEYVTTNHNDSTTSSDKSTTTKENTAATTKSTTSGKTTTTTTKKTTTTTKKPTVTTGDTATTRPTIHIGSITEQDGINGVDYRNSSNWERVVNDVFTAEYGGLQMKVPGWKTYGLYSISMVPVEFEINKGTSAATIAVYSSNSIFDFETVTKKDFDRVLGYEVDMFERTTVDGYPACHAVVNDMYNVWVINTPKYQYFINFLQGADDRDMRAVGDKIISTAKIYY